MFVCSVDLLIMQTLFSTREALKRIFETHRKQLEQKSSYMTVGNQTFGFNSRALCFLSFTTENNSDLTAIRVKLTALHSPFNTQCTPLSPLFLYLPACISLAKEKQMGTSYWQRLIRVLVITTFIYYSPGPGIYFNSLFIRIFSFLNANSLDRAITHQKNIQSKRHLWFMMIMEFSYLAGFSPVKIIFTSNIYSVC